MKRCPQCNRVETEDVLTFCRVDGTPLIRQSSVAGEEAGTLKFGSAPVIDETETRTLPRTKATADGTAGGAAAPTTVMDGRPTSGGKHESSKPKSRRGVVIAVAAIAAVALAASAYLYLSRGDGGAKNSIAVLPFQNASDDPDMEYLSDGISESLINSLSQLPNVRVLARSTMFSFKGKDVNPQEVGRRLGVETVLTGRVVQRGDSLTVQADLVNVEDGSQLWGDRYSREASDIIAVQEEIAREIAGKLSLRLSGEQQGRVSKRYTENAEAYQLYLRGNYHLYKFTPDDLRQAVGYFNEALAKDPNYALAYVGLAAAYGIAKDFGDEAGVARGEANARKAIALDPTLAEAHAMLAAHAFWNRRDATEAQEGFSRSLALNPNSVIAHHYYSWFLIATARFDEAQEHLRRTLELDPLSPSVNVDQGLPLYFSRRYSEARSRYEQALRLDANFGYGHVRLAEACEGAGDMACAVAGLERSAALSDNSLARTQLARALALAGRKEEARRLLEELTAPDTTPRASPYHIALTYSALGETDEAFDSLDRAVAQNDNWLGWAKVDPRLDPLRSDPRFADIMRRVGLP